MINLTVLYPYGKHSKFDMEYYLAKHCQLITATLGSLVTDIHVEEGVSGMPPDAPPAFFCIVHLTFGSPKELEKASLLFSDLVADVPNFTDITPVFQVSEVKRP